MKRLIAACVLVIVAMSVIVACSGGPAGNISGPAVHMNDTNFVQTSITIEKGGSFTLVDDVAVVHVIENGMWNSNGIAIPKQERGAPLVNATLNGSDSQVVGPFNTAGTYHLYCTIHAGMNLTVKVQ